jgi:hypothetical protein
MGRQLWIALGSVAFCGLVAVLLRSEPDTPSQHHRALPATLEEVMAVAEARHLYCAGDPPDRQPEDTLFVSVEPVSSERHTHLILADTHFRHWRGVVRVSRYGSKLFASNSNPAHPERCALWGDLFVYGDPELIEQLVSSPR